MPDYHIIIETYAKLSGSPALLEKFCGGAWTKHWREQPMLYSFCKESPETTGRARKFFFVTFRGIAFREQNGGFDTFFLFSESPSIGYLETKIHRLIEGGGVKAHGIPFGLPSGKLCRFLKYHREFTSIIAAAIIASIIASSKEL